MQIDTAKYLDLVIPMYTSWHIVMNIQSHLEVY